MESRNRVLENQLLVTVRGREKERRILERAVLYFLFSNFRAVLLSARHWEVLYLASAVSSFVSKRDTRSPYRQRRNTLRNGDKARNDDYFEETFFHGTHEHEGRPKNARNHNFGRFRSALSLPTVLSLRVVEQITGSRCARARGTLFGGANSERGRQRKRVRKDTECRKEVERRNKTEREREELRKKIGREYPERLRKTWRHSPAAFCATLDRASQLGKSHTLAEPMSLPTNKQIEAVIIRDYRLLQLDDLALTHGSFIRQPSSLNARI